MSSAMRDAAIRCIDGMGGADGLYPTAIEGLAFMRSTTETVPHPLIIVRRCVWSRRGLSG